MFTHHATLRGLAVRFAIDINPEKQGKFLAATGTPVLSPEQGLALASPGTTILVMNSNYLAEIQTFAGPDFNFLALDSA
jgi:hypothetical protein